MIPLYHTVVQVQITAHQPFCNFQNRPSHHYAFLCEGALDVKWDHLISQNPQLNALKIRIRLPSRYATHDWYS
jgi:hypothetical protein